MRSVLGHSHVLEIVLYEMLHGCIQSTGVGIQTVCGVNPRHVPHVPRELAHLPLFCLPTQKLGNNIH